MGTHNKKKILIVDDKSSSDSLTKNLKLQGFDVYQALTGSSAIKIAKELIPDLILLDVKLPDITGIEVSRVIKNDFELCNIPIILKSNDHIDEESKILGLENGASAYLTQPVELNILIATINSMLRFRYIETELKNKGKYWQLTFDSIKDGICVIDNDHLIIQCNKAFGIIGNKDCQDLIKKNIFDLPDDFDFIKEIFKTSNYENGFEEEIRINSKWYKVSVDSIKDKNASYIIKINDIDKVKTYQNKLSSALFELERSNEDLEQFAYAVSHDLQEPLRMISSYIKLLEKKYLSALDDDGKDFMAFILRGAERMGELIKDLLNYSRLTTKGKKFDEINGNNIIEDVLENLSLNINEKNVELTYEDLPFLFGDRVQITQLFQNLISNAIKFQAEDRKTKIHVSVKKEDNIFWQFAISDNGIGIPEEAYKRIFTIFQRLQDKDNYPGTGIGLSICKKIVERHGGRIWLKSELNKGTTFYFTLPTSLNL